MAMSSASGSAFAEVAVSRSEVQCSLQRASRYHLYYPSRRQASSAFTALVDALRYRR